MDEQCAALGGHREPVISNFDNFTGLFAAGAGAIITMASDLRLATPEAKCAFLFNRVAKLFLDRICFPNCLE